MALVFVNKVLLCVVYVNSPSAHVRTKPCKSLTSLAFPKSLWSVVEVFSKVLTIVFSRDAPLKSLSLVLTSARTPRSRGRSRFLTSQEDARLSLWFTSSESYLLGTQVTAGTCAYVLPLKFEKKTRALNDR